tara:strand:- start:7354 stop:7701 length:348 start_codon:yes stop_codon:yes gene_type:complete
MRLQVTVPLQRGGSFVGYSCKDTASIFEDKNTALQAINAEPSSSFNEPFENKTSMLEFCKKVLLKVAYNRESFARELGKSIRSLKPADTQKLKAWCRTQFAPAYTDIIEVSFAAL